MKPLLILYFLLCVNAVWSQKKIRFGMRQQYVCYNNENETPLTKTIATAYGRLYNDTLEVPLNRCFSNDTLMVFTGVSFKYSFQKLYSLLLTTGSNVWSEINAKDKIFYLQNEYNKLVINRFVYYSKADKLIYIINYVTATNHKISKQAFKTIITTSIQKK